MHAQVSFARPQVTSSAPLSETPSSPHSLHTHTKRPCASSTTMLRRKLCSSSRRAPLCGAHHWTRYLRPCKRRQRCRTAGATASLRLHARRYCTTLSTRLLG